MKKSEIVNWIIAIVLIVGFIVGLIMVNYGLMANYPHIAVAYMLVAFSYMFYNKGKQDGIRETNKHWHDQFWNEN